MLMNLCPAYFNLDPNRVLDIMLDCYEANLSNTAYHRLINKFARTSLVHVLGFKFQYYNGSTQRQTPESLLQLTAHLTKAGLVDVSCVLLAKAPVHTRPLLKCRVELSGSVRS